MWVARFDKCFDRLIAICRLIQIKNFVIVLDKDTVNKSSEPL